MKHSNLTELTDEELLVKKKKLKSSQITHAVIIGFLAGIAIFGIVSWSLTSEKQLGFLLPMLIPIFTIYRLVKNSEKNKDLKKVLKERQLN